jgi:hypothetical protein
MVSGHPVALVTGGANGIGSVKHERLKDSKGRKIPTIIAEDLSESAEEEIAARKHEDQLLAKIDNDGRASLAKYAQRCDWAYSTSGEPNKTLVRRTIIVLTEQKLIREDKRDGLTLTDKGKKALKKSQEEAPQAKGKPNGRASSAGYKVVDDCPQDLACALCKKGRQGREGPTAKICGRSTRLHSTAPASRLRQVVVSLSPRADCTHKPAMSALPPKSGHRRMTTGCPF